MKHYEWQYAFVNERLKNFGKITENITSEIFQEYYDTSFEWFKFEIIIISFIDKMTIIDFMKYRQIIMELFDILINSVKQIYENIQNDAQQDKDNECSFALNYIEYLLVNKDLTKLKPTSDFPIVYIHFYISYYDIEISANDDNPSSGFALYHIIDNNIFNDEIFSLLYDLISFMVYREKIYDQKVKNNKRHNDDDDDNQDNSKKLKLS
jgi:hypothetical protein